MDGLSVTDFVDEYLNLCEEYQMCIDLHGDIILKTFNDRKVLQVVEFDSIGTFEAYENYIDAQLGDA